MLKGPAEAHRPWMYIILPDVPISDESEPSWLEPELKRKNFQLDSAWLVTFFPAARNQKLAKNEQKF